MTACPSPVRNPTVTVTAVLPKADPFEALGRPLSASDPAAAESRRPRVQQIADALPISRPAASRHLRLLKEAGMVAEQAEGTRRIYHLEQEGVEAVREYLEAVWGEARRGSASWPRTPGGDGDDRRGAAFPVRSGVRRGARVRNVDRADRAVVAGGPHRQWCRRRPSFSRAGSAAASTSRARHGQEHEWGVVTVRRPPDLVVYRWHLGSGSGGREDVAVTFVPVDAAMTRVEIEQSGWNGSARSLTSTRSQPNRVGVVDAALPCGCGEREHEDAD